MVKDPSILLPPLLLKELKFCFLVNEAIPEYDEFTL